jgi:hypothetical protein
MALNNMSVTLLERSCPKQSRATSRDALHVVRRLSQFLDSVDEGVASHEHFSWLADIDADLNERMRRAGERMSQSSKVVAASAEGTTTPWEVDPILLDHHAHNPALQRFYSTEDAAVGNRIHPIKIDIFAESEDGASLPEDIVSAIILYNYALAIALDGDDHHRPRDSVSPPNTTKLLLMSMELTYQRLDARGDVSEQLGLHTLAMLSARAVIAMHRGNSESIDLYRRTHRSLRNRARALSSLEEVLFGPKQDTATAA